eukprot:660832_1
MHLAKAKKNTAMKHTAKAKTHEKEVTQQQQISTDQMSGFAVKFAALSTNTNDDSPSKSIVKHSENRLPSYLINRGRTKSSQPSTILSQSSDPTQRISTNIINSSNTAQSIPPSIPTKGSATQQKRRKARKLKRIEKKKHKKKKHKKQSTNTTTTHTKKKKSNTKKKKDKKHKKKKKHKKQSTNTTTTHTKKKKSNTKKKKDKKHKKKKKHKKQSTNTTTTHNKKTKPKQTRKALVPAVKIRICQRILAHPDYRKMGPKRLCLNDPEYHGNGSNIYSWIREYESTGTIESRKKRGGRRSDTQDIELEIVKRLMNRNGNKRISNTDISDAAKDIDKNQKHCTYSSGWIFKMKERCRTGKHGAIGIEFAKLFDN